MKHTPSWTLPFIASAMITIASNPAYADAVGPYYANPSWDQTLPASTRFIVLSNFNSAAVLDRETGLVWERSPNQLGFSSSTDPLFQLPWDFVEFGCLDRKTGGRLGWRLPTVDELLSLVDPTVSPPGPTLPAGHPFTNVQSSRYWTATQRAGGSVSSQNAYIVNFAQGFVDAGLPTALGWCVRGDSHATVY